MKGGTGNSANNKELIQNVNTNLFLFYLPTTNLFFNVFKRVKTVTVCSSKGTIGTANLNWVIKVRFRACGPDSLGSEKLSKG